MERKLMVTAVEIVSDLGVSRAYAYNLIKRLNAELEAKGYEQYQNDSRRNRAQRFALPRWLIVLGRRFGGVLF